MRRLSVLLAVCFVLTASSAASTFAFPQDSNNTGAIRGMTKDEAGAVIAGATVKAVNNQSGQTFITQTNYDINQSDDS